MTKAGYEWGKAFRSIEDYARKLMNDKNYNYKNAGERVLDIIDCVADLRITNEKRIARVYHMVYYNYNFPKSLTERTYFFLIMQYIDKISILTNEEIKVYENEKNKRV